MAEGQWLLVTLTAGVGGSLLSIGSAAGVALMGQSKGMYTFFSHLKWTLGGRPRLCRQHLCPHADQRRPFLRDRVGDGVTPVALSHHRTCGSASGGSLNTLESSHRIEQRHQP
jgi:hypothetical protein